MTFENFKFIKGDKTIQIEIFFPNRRKKKKNIF